MKKSNIFIAIGLILILASFVFTGYNLWDNYRAGRAANNVLKEISPILDSNQTTEEESGTDVEVEYPDYILNPNMDMPVKNIDGTDYIGIISIPAIERELPVCSEWSYKNLKIATCRYSGTAYLNNMVICAHNYDIYFGSLKYLSYGDMVTFTDMDGNVFTYKVIEIETLQPTDVEAITTGDCDLTLFTCTIGGAARVTVRCERV